MGRRVIGQSTIDDNAFEKGTCAHLAFSIMASNLAASIYSCLASFSS